MTKHLQERWENRWHQIVSIGSGIDCADINTQLEASLALEDLAPSLGGLLGSPDQFQLCRVTEQAA